MLKWCQIVLINISSSAEKKERSPTGGSLQSTAHQQSPGRALWERSLLISITTLHDYFQPFTVLVGTAGCELGWGQAVVTRRRRLCARWPDTCWGRQETPRTVACMTSTSVPSPLSLCTHLAREKSSQANPAPFYFLHFIHLLPLAPYFLLISLIFVPILDPQVSLINFHKVYFYDRQINFFYLEGKGKKEKGKKPAPLANTPS